MTFQLPDDARVWIYQSSRLLTAQETDEIQTLTTKFVVDWASHGRELVAEGRLLHRRFLVLAVDERVAGASGCSIDKSTAFIRQLQEKYELDLLDRLTFAFRNDENEIQTAANPEFSSLYHEKKITDNTLIFNNLVANLGDFRMKWEVRLGDSWHKRLIS